MKIGDMAVIKGTTGSFEGCPVFIDKDFINYYLVKLANPHNCDTRIFPQGYKVYVSNRFLVQVQEGDANILEGF